MTDSINETEVEVNDETATDQASNMASALSDTARRYVLATLGALAVAGDNVASAVDNSVGPTVDKLVERGQALEQDRLQPVTRAAAQTAGAAKSAVAPVMDAASSAGRQATSVVSSGASQVKGAASSAASTIGDLARKQAKVASTSALTVLVKQLDALQANLTQIRDSLEAEIESREQADEILDATPSE